MADELSLLKTRSLYWRWAHNLIHRNESRKTWTLGTSRRTESVTREPNVNVNKKYLATVVNEPPRLRIHRSSRFRNKLSSSNDKSSGIDDSASRAMRRSTGIPEIFVLMTGTYASGTPCGHKNRSMLPSSKSNSTYRDFRHSIQVLKHGLKDIKEIFSRDVFGHNA